MERISRFAANGLGGFEILSEDSGLAFGRGWREAPGSDRQDVLIALPVSEQPTSTTLDRLAHEYSLREQLDGSWAVRPLQLLRDRGQAVLVLEDPGGVLLGSLLGAPMELGRFLPIAVGVAAALGEAHRHGLIHKDVKPGNILVNTARNEIRLTGFGIASRLTRERQAVEPPEFIGGTLAYMAPEQTGRMNRSIDSRSDLYALGMTFYEMLTGSLPFAASDPMEWVHCHIARQPPAPVDRVSGIPEALSSIVMKLTAKTVEDRYQTAAGVEADLRRCLMDWQRQGRIEPFPLATHDISDQLRIPERLYGREREIAALLEAFDRAVVQGTSELVLVSGYSGVGKSSVVNELQKVLVPPRGLFASGKFDQYKRDIPYATLAQGFQTLIRQILLKSEAELARWREALRQALDPHGGLITDLMPELKLIIGEQEPVSDLPAPEARQRFQLLLRRFIGVFARPEHPLALFLDDLQWLDAATLDLLEDLLTQESIPHLLLIGAYRDNEVDAAHPLMRKLGAIKAAGRSSVEEIALSPLDARHVSQLIADALQCEPDRAADLARLILQKTDGNPFFINQFLSILADESLIAFDAAQSRWSWDLERIHAQGYTDNVADLMIGKLVRLPAATQQALQNLACLGNSATSAMLAMVHDITEPALHASLVEARHQELIDFRENAYRFVHDRVHEAAYALIPAEQRAAMHLRIGRMLVAHTPAGQLDEAVFEIVNQLNRASSLVTAPQEREQLAEFNLLAGKRAQASSAYVSALNYLTAGAALLTDASWRSRRELGFELELARADCEFASGKFTDAEQRLMSLSVSAVTTAERVAVASAQVDLYQGTGRVEAVAVGLRALRQLGIDLPAEPTEADARHAYDGVCAQLGARAIEDLIDQPLMNDPDSLAAVELLIRVAMPAHYSGRTNLYAVAVCRAVSLGLEQGHSEASGIAYVQLGTMTGPLFDQPNAGYRFGKLGYELVERPGLQRFRARTITMFGYLVPWTQHVRNGREVLSRGFDLTSRIGEISYAIGACGTLTTHFLMAGDPLVETQKQAELGLAFAHKVGFATPRGRWFLSQLGLIRNLRGLTSRFGFFDNAEFLEADLEHDLVGKRALDIPDCWYFIRKLQARYLAGEYSDALQAASRAQPMIATAHSLDLADYHFYGALCHAAVHESATSEDRQYHRARLAEHLETLDTWAVQCPENFANRAALVGAEIARIEGRDADAMRLYEQAIRSARDNGFVHNEAIAYEVAARFYDARGFETFADAYLRKARDCYLRWGADGKVQQLDRLFPHLAAPEATAAIGSAMQQLDTASVVKASQALSGEIELPTLIDRLMTIALENAGADRGLLILPLGDEYLIQAEARAAGDRIDVTLRQQGITAITCPESLVRYVIRTRESVILDEAAKPNLFSADEYLRLQQSKSMLCLPLIKQRKLTGILLLENALASHAFTAARIAVLELLASQAAISLENAALYNDLQLQVGLLQQLPVSAWTLEPDGTPDFVNQVWLKFSGQTAEFVRSHPEAWMTALHPDDREIAVTSFWEGVRSGEGFAFECRSLRAWDGTYRRHLQQAVVLRNTDGSVLKFVGTTTDIDDQKRAEETLRQAQADLAHVSRVATLSAMTASIAHEVSQPLSGILTNANTGLRMLAAEPPNVAGAAETARRTIRDANRASDVIKRLREMFSNKAPSTELVDLNDAARDVIAISASELQKRGALLRTRFVDGLPPVSADRVQLQQVILNLLLNAADAMDGVENRPRTLTVRTELESAGAVRLDVCDVGTGIHPDSVEALFEPFHTTKANGMGVGLSICRSIIESHNGRLWAQQNDGPGATFGFSLPVASEPTGASGRAGAAVESA